TRGPRARGARRDPETGRGSSHRPGDRRPLAAPPRDRGLLERARRILIACVTALAACRGDRGGNAALPVPGGGAGGPRVTVEVLNASGTPGLAKVGTRMLRRAGIDVLTYGNAPETVGALDSTRIVVRRGTEEVGRRVRRALGLGRGVVQLERAQRLREPRQLIRLLERVVLSPDKHVLQSHAATKPRQRRDDRRQRVLLLDGHQLVPQLRRRRVQ